MTELNLMAMSLKEFIKLINYVRLNTRSGAGNKVRAVAYADAARYSDCTAGSSLYNGFVKAHKEG